MPIISMVIAYQLAAFLLKRGDETFKRGDTLFLHDIPDYHFAHAQHVHLGQGKLLRSTGHHQGEHLLNETLVHLDRSICQWILSQ